MHIPNGLAKDLWDGHERYERKVSKLSNEEQQNLLKIDILTGRKKKDNAKRKDNKDRIDELNSLKKTFELKYKELINEGKDETNDDVIKTIEDLECADSLLEELENHNEQLKQISKSTMKELKERKVIVERYEKNRTFFENTIMSSTEDILAKWRIYRQAYMSRCFIGPHVEILMKNADEIMDEIKVVMIEHRHEDVNENDIIVHCERTKRILKALNVISSITKSTEEQSEEMIGIMLDRIEDLSDLWREHGLSVTVKMHITECHLITFIKDIKVLGIFSEEAIERLHHIYKKLQALANDNSFAATENFVQGRLDLKVSPDGESSKKAVMESRKRNFRPSVVEAKKKKKEENEKIKLENFKTPLRDV